MMEPAAARALERLRADDAAALDELARLLVDEATATPLAEIARPRWLASQLATGLEAAVRGDGLRDRLAARVDEQLATWQDEERPLGTWLPEEVEQPLRTALARPYAPSEELVFRALDHDLLRTVMSEVLEGTLRRFRKRLRNLDQGLLGGFGERAERAAKRGRGLLGNVADSLTGGVAGAVKQEVESRMDEVVQEFLSTATRQALRRVAQHVADPEHAEAYGELRVELLQTIEDTEVRVVAEEIEKIGVMDYVDIALDALRTELDRDDFVDRTEERLQALLDEVGDGTLGAWLDEVDLREVWVDSTTELLAERLQAVVHTERFEQWWAALFV